MPYDPAKHHRHSIRLRGYDYATAGAYFVTICTHGHAKLFGEICNEQMVQHAAGAMIGDIWEALPKRFVNMSFVNMSIDTYVVMPNHFHTVVLLHQHADAPKLGDIIGTFKSLTTRAYREGMRDSGWPAFRLRLWQRNYYERIVRSDESLQHIREYIATNPARWKDDALHV